MYEVENIKSGVMADQRQQASMIDLERTKEKYKTIIRQKNQESLDLSSKLERKSKEVESKDEKLEWLQVQLKSDSQTWMKEKRCLEEEIVQLRSQISFHKHVLKEKESQRLKDRQDIERIEQHVKSQTEVSEWMAMKEACRLWECLKVANMWADDAQQEMQWMRNDLMAEKERAVWLVETSTVSELKEAHRQEIQKLKKKYSQKLSQSQNELESLLS